MTLSRAAPPRSRGCTEPLERTISCWQQANELRPNRCDALRILVENGWPWELIDVEPLLDGETIVLHYLGPHELDGAILRLGFELLARSTSCSSLLASTSRSLSRVVQAVATDVARLRVVRADFGWMRRFASAARLPYQG